MVLISLHRTVHAQHDEGAEKEDWPYLAAWQRGYGLGVDLKDQSGPLFSHLFDVPVLIVSHVPEVGENDEAGKETGGAVDDRGEQTIPEKKTLSAQHNSGLKIIIYLHG